METDNEQQSRVERLAPRDQSSIESGTRRVFGHVESYHEGSLFQSRQELHDTGVHRPLQAGISGSGDEGADSIVLSGGYEDDHDYGDEVLYTGHGGRDQNTGKQIKDQQFTVGNKALAVSKVHGLPVRVIRGATLDSPYAPQEGYRYDGLYYVDDFWSEVGRSGFKVWRYRLVKGEPTKVPSRSHDLPLSLPTDLRPGRVEATVQRLVRDTRKSREIKELYDYACQICGIRLVTPAGAYAEAAHIRPLGDPHNGPDSSDNIICLCPNHHVLFDMGAISINDDMSLIEIEGGLNLAQGHAINVSHLKYHREHYATQSANAVGNSK